MADIHVHWARHNELTTALNELSYIPDAVIQKAEELESAQKSLKAAQSDHARLEREQKDAYKSLQDMTSRSTRLSFKLRRQGEEKLAMATAAKDRMYEATFADCQDAYQRTVELKPLIESLDLELGDLQQLAARRIEVYGQLTVLYDKVFTGPTPGFPEEDEVESTVFALSMQVEELTATIESETKLLKVYDEFIETGRRAQYKFDKAQHAPVHHNPNGGSSSKRGKYKRQAIQAYNEARQLEKKLVEMQPGRIVRYDEALPESSFFQSVRSGLGDKGFHVHQFLGYHMQSKGRIEGDKSRLEGELASAERELEAQRTALRQLRCSIMEASVPPPMYQ